MVPTPPQTAGDATARCERLFATVDAAVERAGVADGAAARVEGFPYLRVDRYLASYRTEPLSRMAAAWWVHRMRVVDEKARAIELANLPSSGRNRLARRLREPGGLTASLEGCAGELMRRDLADSSALDRIRAAARVPDDYQTWKRVVGLYPVTGLAFYAGVLDYQSETLRTFATPLDGLPRAGRLVAYAPRTETSSTVGNLAEMLARSRNNPLGVPLPQGEDLSLLFEAHAPIFEIDELDRNDRIGTPVLGASGAAYTDTSDIKVFVRLAHTRYGGEPLLQLVYSIWFPARPKTGSLDLLGGRLDGVTWRVTLDHDGEPLIYDTMHNCGCYQMFFPTSRARRRSHEPGIQEGALVPARLGFRRAGERVVLRIAARTHYIENVRYGAGTEAEVRRTYAYSNSEQLRSLERPGVGRRSLYRPDGIVSGSERGERYLYWPMGVREPGAMRQWGRHATAFIGRRHFDDPDLIERYFELDLGRGG